MFDQDLSDFDRQIPEVVRLQKVGFKRHPESAGP